MNKTLLEIMCWFSTEEYKKRKIVLTLNRIGDEKKENPIVFDTKKNITKNSPGNA
jgi:hypothetical protein